jgi:hypothetical protein
MFCCIIKINILDDLPQQNKVGECKKKLFNFAKKSCLNAKKYVGNN